MGVGGERCLEQFSCPPETRWYHISANADTSNKATSRSFLTNALTQSRKSEKWRVVAVPMFVRLVVVVATLLVAVEAFRGGFRSRHGISRQHLQSEVVAGQVRAISLSMASDGDASETPMKQGDDISKYSVGQTLNGELVSAKDFGIFVQIEGSKTRVLLPRSLLSRGEFSKLTNMAKQKSTISFDIASVDTEKKTLSGTYNSGVEKRDLSSITDDDVKKTEYSATVVGTHDFGIFVELDGFGVDGLVPASMLPRGGSPKTDYSVGDNVSVLINQMADEGKKMTLSLVGGSAGGSSEGGSLDGTGFSKDQWIQGVVTSVSNFGLFVRPAGFDLVGLVHARQIPRDLMASLKKQVDMSNPGEKTDVEMLFQEGDVVSCRVNSFNGPKKVDMSMLPPKDEADDDDYVVDGRDPEEGDEEKGGRPRRPSKYAEDNIDSQEVSGFSGESKLLWWRGAPYTPLGRPGNDEDIEMAVIKESDKVVEGVWRRMFEVDLREDAANFASRVEEQELKELQSDIGELMGLDDDMFEMNDLTMMSRGPSSVGAGAMGLMDQLPEDWKSELSFFKETSTTQSALDTMYKGGKAAEQSEFDALIREVEVEIAANKKSGGSEPALEVAPEAISAEAAAPAESVEEAAAPAEEAAEAPAEADA